VPWPAACHRGAHDTSTLNGTARNSAQRQRQRARCHNYLHAHACVPQAAVDPDRTILNDHRMELILLPVHGNTVRATQRDADGGTHYWGKCRCQGHARKHKLRVTHEKGGSKTVTTMTAHHEMRSAVVWIVCCCQALCISSLFSLLSSLFSLLSSLFSLLLHVEKRCREPDNSRLSTLQRSSSHDAQSLM
jgi:hypothetical protein